MTNKVQYHSLEAFKEYIKNNKKEKSFKQIMQEFKEYATAKRP